MKRNFYCNNTKFIILLLFLISIYSVHGQMSGNQVYRNRNSYENNQPQVSDLKHFYATDSTMVINVNVLLNKRADQFKISLGLNEEAETPKKAIEKMNTRIQNFTKRLGALGVKKEDFYVDFISQTKVYDVSISDDKKLISEKIKGFEIKKNIIIKTNDHSKIEKIIYEASDFQIYDIIKIDYLNTDLEKIHQDLMTEANKIADWKREDFFKRFKKEIIGTPMMNSSFNYVFYIMFSRN